MLFENKKLYEETRDLKKGTAKLTGLLEELRNRIENDLSLSVLNIVYDTIEIGPAKGRPRLSVIVEFSADYHRLRTGVVPHGLFPIGEGILPAARKVVLHAFSSLVSQRTPPTQYNANNVLLIIESFEAEAINQAANAFYRADAGTIASDFSANSVWKITGFGSRICVFFLTEKAKLAASESGVQARIERACFSAIKLHDEFHFINERDFRVHFDTKENLDMNYQGNLYYYFK